MFQEIRQAWRALSRIPGFTTIAVVTLALGIGGTSAMFTIVNRVVLHPLPFRAADRLVVIWGSKPHEGQPEIPFSQPDFEDLRTRSRSYDAIGAWALARGNLTGATEPEQVQYAVVTSNFLEILSVRPALGRSFQPEEDTPGAGPVALISDALWRRRFGGAADVIGGTLRLDDRSVEVIGVLPPDFTFLTFPRATDVWLPRGADPSPGRRFARGMRSMGVLARLHAGTSLDAARAEGASIAEALAAEHPRFNTGRRFLIVPLNQQVVRDIRVAAIVLLGAVGCVLLIACANVTSLLLARASRRGREFSVRAALGASSWHIFRLQLAETLVLGALGGTAGLFLAVWLVDLLARVPYRTDNLFVPYSVPRGTIGVDGAAIGVTAGLTIAIALVCAAAPGLRSCRARIVDLLGGMLSTSSGPRQQRARAILVAGEVAVALVLLVGCGLMLRSYVRLQHVDPGFAPSEILSVQVTLSSGAYRDRARVAAYYQEGIRRPGDPATIGASVAILGVAAFVGCYLPARRATKVDPAVALRTN